MGSHNYGEAFRAAIGSLAFLAATWQLVMRFAWAHTRVDIVGQRERAGAFATALILFGVGLAQVTHLRLGLSISSFIIGLGVCGSLWANWRVYQAIRYLDERDEASGETCRSGDRTG